MHDELAEGAPRKLTPHPELKVPPLDSIDLSLPESPTWEPSFGDLVTFDEGGEPWMCVQPDQFFSGAKRPSGTLRSFVGFSGLMLRPWTGDRPDWALYTPGEVAANERSWELHLSDVCGQETVTIEPFAHSKRTETTAAPTFHVGASYRLPGWPECWEWTCESVDGIRGNGPLVNAPDGSYPRTFKWTVNWVMTHPPVREGQRFDFGRGEFVVRSVERCRRGWDITKCDGFAGYWYEDDSTYGLNFKNDRWLSPLPEEPSEDLVSRLQQGWDADEAMSSEGAIVETNGKFPTGLGVRPSLVSRDGDTHVWRLTPNQCRKVIESNPAPAPPLVEPGDDEAMDAFMGALEERRDPICVNCGDPLGYDDFVTVFVEHDDNPTFAGPEPMPPEPARLHLMKGCYAEWTGDEITQPRAPSPLPRGWKEALVKQYDEASDRLGKWDDGVNLLWRAITNLEALEAAQPRIIWEGERLVKHGFLTGTEGVPRLLDVLDETSDGPVTVTITEGHA